MLLPGDKTVSNSKNHMMSNKSASEFKLLDLPIFIQHEHGSIKGEPRSGLQAMPSKSPTSKLNSGFRSASKKQSEKRHDFPTLNLASVRRNLQEPTKLAETTNPKVMEVKDKDNALKSIGLNHLMPSRYSFGEGREKDRKNSAPGSVTAPSVSLSEKHSRDSSNQSYSNGLNKYFESGEVVILASSICTCLPLQRQIFLLSIRL